MRARPFDLLIRRLPLRVRTRTPCRRHASHSSRSNGAQPQLDWTRTGPSSSFRRGLEDGLTG
jgi:hypothetical protein